MRVLSSFQGQAPFGQPSRQPFPYALSLPPGVAAGREIGRGSAARPKFIGQRPRRNIAISASLGPWHLQRQPERPNLDHVYGNCETRLRLAPRPTDTLIDRAWSEIRVAGLLA